LVYSTAGATQNAKRKATNSVNLHIEFQAIWWLCSKSKILRIFF